ncbi:MAG: hypothetical protein V3R71_06390 [Gemmatimonadales bacterium]
MGVSNPTSLPVTSPVTNPVLARGENPRTIFSSADLRFWGNLDNRVDGTPPDITTLTDLTAFGRDPTQTSEGARPELEDLGGKNYASLSGGRFWATSAGTDYIAANTKALSIWFVGSPIFGPVRTFFDLGEGTTTDTGMSFFFVAGNVLQARVLTTGGLVVLDTGAYTTIPTDIFEVRLDGVNLKIYANGIELASVAETGTMANGCETLAIGRDIAGGGGSGRVREVAIVAGDVAPTVLQRQRMLAYLQENQ